MRVCDNCGERGVFRYQALICDRCFDEKIEGNDDNDAAKSHEEIRFPKEDIRLLRIFKISDETPSE